MLKKLFRAAFTLVGGIVGYGAFLLTKFILTVTDAVSIGQLTKLQQFFIAATFVLIFVLIFFKLTPTLDRHSKKVTQNIESDLKNIPTNDIVVGTAGLIIGLIIAFLVSNVYNLINVPYLPVVFSVLTYLVMGYLGVVVATRKGKNLLSAINAGLRTPPAGGKGKSKGGDATPKIFDTSVIIDGRIADIMKTGAPVMGIPPKTGTMMLAAPCAISSVLERCLSPVTPSATVAERRDSMAPSIAMVKAEGSSK